MDDNDPMLYIDECNDDVVPRTYMRQHSDNQNPRRFMRNSINADPRYSIGSSFNAETRTSRSISVHPDARLSYKNDAKLARSISVHIDPRMSVRESIKLKETQPLKRNTSIKMMKAVNHQKHSCTDIQCLIIFACFIAVWIYVANYALLNGQLDNVFIPVDTNNRKCGLDSGVRNKQKLYFFDLDKCIDPLTPITGCETKQICVEACPQKSFQWQDHINDFTTLTENLICDDTVDKKNLNDRLAVEKAINENRCSGLYWKSNPLFNHCIWDFSEACNVLSNTLKDRKRRSLLLSEKFVNITALTEKYEKFINTTKSWCQKQKQTQSKVSAKPDSQATESNSRFNRIVTAIISKFDLGDINAEHVILDLKNSYVVLLLAFIIHLVAVLIFITLLRWLAAPLVWISIVGVLTGLSIALFYSLKEYRYFNENHLVPQHGTNLKATLRNVQQNPKVWLYLSIVVGAVLVIILLILIVIRKRIKIAIAIIKEASKAITSIKSSIFFPIFPGILYIFVTILAGIILLYLSSIGDFKYKMVQQIDRNNSIGAPIENCTCTGPQPERYKVGSECEPVLFEQYCHLENNGTCMRSSCSYNEFRRNKKTNLFIFFNVFGYFWVIFFISAYEDMVLACTFSMWYWTFHKKDIPKLPLLKAIWITTIYHLGTVAFGSLILAICRMIRYTLELIEKKVKMYQNTLTRAILCCMKCFFWLLENFLRFLNRNAYITCVIHSTNFCTSSKKAFTLITQNILRVYAVDKVSIFLFFLSKILVTGCTSCATYFFLINYPKLVSVHYPLVPVALVAISSYVIADVIFSTYSVAVDTLFFCFLEDSTENDGSIEKPFYMSKQLNKLLGKKRRK